MEGDDEDDSNGLVSGDACDLLAVLPAQVLLNNVLPSLDADDVIRLGCCCSALRAAAYSDDVWRPRCEALSWGPFARGVTWQAGFSSRRKMLCVECGKPSRYVFALLGCRLCEGCEHTNLRYGLVTALEAVERYGLPYSSVASMPYHEACHTRFYLRSSVEAAAAVEATTAGVGARGARTVGRGPESGAGPKPGGEEVEEGDEDMQEAENGGEETEEEEGADAEQQQQRRQGQSDEEDDDEEEEEDGDGSDAEGDRVRHRQGGGGGSAAAGGERRAADRAARKAAKKAAKEAQRQKRQQRHLALAPAGPSARVTAVAAAAASTGALHGLGPHGMAGGSNLPLGSSPPAGRRARQQQQQFQQGQQQQRPVETPTHGSVRSRSAGRQRGRRGSSAAAGSSPPGSRAAGPLMVAQDDGDGGAVLPLEGQAVPLARNSRGRSRHAGGAGGNGAAGGAGGSGGAAAASGGGGGRHMMKMKSGWAAEREALMAEWGQYGISGLQLAS